MVLNAIDMVILDKLSERMAQSAKCYARESSFEFGHTEQSAMHGSHLLNPFYGTKCYVWEPPLEFAIQSKVLRTEMIILKCYAEQSVTHESHLLNPCYGTKCYV